MEINYAKISKSIVPLKFAIKPECKRHPLEYVNFMKSYQRHNGNFFQKIISLDLIHGTLHTWCHLKANYLGQVLEKVEILDSIS